MFLFMGEIIVRGHLSRNFYLGLMKWMKKIPGAMLHTNIIACAIFAAISGSGVATTAAIGSIAIPEMKQRNYPIRPIYGSIAAAGTLGLMIPPSLQFILFGSLTDLSIVCLFFAGFVPGLLLAGFFLLWTTFSSFYGMRKGTFNPTYDQDSALTHWQALKGVAPLFITIFALLGSLYAGFATPVESAALGTFLAVIFGFWLGDLKFDAIWESAKTASKSTAMIVTLMMGAQYFTFTIARTNINRHLTDWVVSSGFSNTSIIIVLGLIFLVLGCFMDGGSITLLTVPLLAPIMRGMGIDLVWVAIFTTLYVMIGQITPPLGLSLFMVQGVDREAAFGDVVKGALPYLIIMILFSAFLIIFPKTVTWLPELLGFM